MGVTLTFPLSHNAPLYVTRFPHYDRALPRLAEAVSHAVPDLFTIDVGANIGDSAATVLHQTRARVLCVEGNREFVPFLRANLGQWPGRWELEEALLGERQGPLTGSIVSRGGTAKLSPQSAGSRIYLTTLDCVIEQHGDFGDASLLKIDTDGFDGAILAGARGFLQRAQPILFFEYHPVLWRQFGGHDETVFAALHHAGYESALLYANTGELLIEVKLTATDALADVRRFLLSGPSVEYLDVAMFGTKHSELAARFVASERERFSVER